MKRFSLLPPGLLVALCLSGSAAAQKAVLVVRHAENSGDKLTEPGLARGERLAKMLANTGVAAIYSTDTKRTTGTAAPFAEARKVPVQLYDTGDGKNGLDSRAFVAMLRAKYPDDVVLVVGHSNTVPELLKTLGCAEEVTIAPREYDNLFIVVPRESGGATLVRLKY